MTRKAEASQKTLKRYEERLEELGVNVKSFKEVVAFLQEQLYMMAFYWSFEKLEVCDSELTESWIVETLKPDNAQAFFSALDTFSLCWQVFTNQFEGLVADLVEYSTESEKHSRDIELTENDRSFSRGLAVAYQKVLAKLGVEAKNR